MPSTIRFRRRPRSQGGWTLVELSVATAVGLIVLAAFVAVTLSINASVMAVGNYNDLNRLSRQTLDRLSRDIRNATSVSTASSTTFIVLTNTFGSTNLFIYNWDGSNHVTREVTTTAGAIIEGPDVVLIDCDYLAFHYYIRIPTNNLEFINVTNTIASTNQTKLVSVSWRCSRSVLGSKLNTESVQTANVALRN